MNKTIAKFRRIQDRLAGKKSHSVEVSYEIECDCGEVVKGIRRNSWIESECSACGEAVFVLPVNVYPSTKSVPSEILGGTFRERLGVVSKELLRRSKREEDVESEPGSSAGAGKTKGSVPEKAKWKLPKFRLPRIDLKRLIIRTFSPFRLLMMAVIATAGIAGWLMISQQQFDQAQKDWLESTTAIAERLDDGKLAGILPEIERAIEAGGILEKADAEFRRLQNLQKETEGFEALSPTGLVDIFHLAYNDENRLKPDAASRVKEGCAAGWFLIDANVIKTTSDEDKWLIDFPVTPGLHPVSVVLPQEALSSLLHDVSTGRIVFAAQLSVRAVPENDEDGQWVLLTDAASFAVLTHSAYASAAGFDVDEDPELQQVIESQQQWVETGTASKPEQF